MTVFPVPSSRTWLVTSLASRKEGLPRTTANPWQEMVQDLPPLSREQRSSDSATEDMVSDAPVDTWGSWTRPLFEDVEKGQGGASDLQGLDQTYSSGEQLPRKRNRHPGFDICNTFGDCRLVRGPSAYRADLPSDQLPLAPDFLINPSCHI